MLRSVICIMFVFFTILLYGQGKENSLKDVPFNERIVTGGGFGLGFGSDQDFVSISPVVGYQLTRKLMAGAGVTYRYTNFKLVDPSMKLHDYGINPFARLMVYQNIFIQAEFEHLNYEFPLTYTETMRKTFDSFMAGGGFFQPLGDKVGVYFMALYNFSYREPQMNEYTAYNSPLVIRAGINIGSFSF